MEFYVGICVGLILGLAMGWYIFGHTDGPHWWSP